MLGQGGDHPHGRSALQRRAMRAPDPKSAPSRSSRAQVSTARTRRSKPRHVGLNRLSLTPPTCMPTLGGSRTRRGRQRIPPWAGCCRGGSAHQGWHAVGQHTPPSARARMRKGPWCTRATACTQTRRISASDRARRATAGHLVSTNALWMRSTKALPALESALWWASSMARRCLSLAPRATHDGRPRAASWDQQQPASERRRSGRHCCDADSRHYLDPSLRGAPAARLRPAPRVDMHEARCHIAPTRCLHAVR